MRIYKIGYAVIPLIFCYSNAVLAADPGQCGTPEQLTEQLGKDALC